MAVRTAQVDVGGVALTLRRSAKNMIAIERRLGTLDLQKLFTAEGSYEDKVRKLCLFLYELTAGSPERPSEEALFDLLTDGTDSNLLGIAEMIGQIMSDGPNPPFVPTSHAMVRRMLDLADLQAGETLLDPCCGDGRALTEGLARGAWVIGHELDEGRAKVSRDAAADVKAAIHCTDGLNADFGKADVIFLYTLQPWNNLAQPKLLQQCKPGARIVSHDFDFFGWPKAHEETFEGKRIYLWRIDEVRTAFAPRAA